MIAIHPLMLERLEEYQQTELFYEMELPLSLVLAKMEMAGIKVDASRLETMQVEFAERLKEIEQRVFEIAGKSSI